MEKLMERLKEPFAPEQIQWKPGAVSKDKTRAMALAYVDSRVYMARLDQVAPDWTDDYEVISLEDRVIVLCRLTVAGVTRCGDGEALLVDRGEPDPNAVTSASAQAFKRACAKFGLGRYLYSIPRRWVEYDPERKYFTRDGLAELDALATVDGSPGSTTAVTPAANGNGSGSTDNGDNSVGNGKDAQIRVKFGKHAGKTLGQILTEDPDYLEWLADNWRWPRGREAAERLVAALLEDAIA